MEVGGGHLGEYLSSLIKGWWLSLRVWKEHRGFDCIQACNPPDLWFLIALFYKAFCRIRFVFDHHDVCPELYLSRFGGSKGGIGYKVMLLLEKATFRTADAVISTNESYKTIAIKRGGMSEQFVKVVRNGPDLDKFVITPPDPAIKTPVRIVVGYLGNMNPQDGVDKLLEAARFIVEEKNREEFYFVFVGKGDSSDDLLALRDAWDLNENVEFTGRISDTEMLRYLNSCDICVQPDPPNPLNEISTMNKVMEYMALAKPVVAFDLIETRFSCGKCAIYAEGDTAEALADKILELADDEGLRMKMGRNGRARVENFLAWRFSEKNLVDLYGSVFGIV